MALSDIRTQIINKLESVSGVVNVRAGKPHIRSIEDFPVDTTNNRINWWEVYCTSVDPEPLHSREYMYYYTFVIDGLVAYESDSTWTWFEELVEDICEAFLTDADLGGTTEFGDLGLHSAHEDVGIPHAELFLVTVPGNVFLRATIEITLRDINTRTLSL